jgi:hypothetical protein
LHAPPAATQLARIAPGLFVNQWRTLLGNSLPLGRTRTDNRLRADWRLLTAGLPVPKVKENTMSARIAPVCLIAACLVLLPGGAFAAMISQYTFDSDASDSVGSNDGTLANGASIVSDGERGYVVSLDGDDDYVSFPYDAMAAGRSEMTLAMWVRPDTWSSGDTLWDEYYWGNYWEFTLTYGGFYTRDSSTGQTGSRNNDISMPALSTGEWQHVALVYSVNEGMKAIYIDGELDTSSTTSIDTLTSYRDAARLGYACEGYNFDGKVDDLRLYSDALSGTEVRTLYRETAADVTEGLVSRYTFDSDASDSVGDNDGTLTDGASIVSDGERGYVLSLDGTNDYVNLPTTGLTGGRSELTLCMWVKPDETAATNTIWDEHNNWYWEFSVRQDTWATRDSSTGTEGSRNNDLAMPSLGSGSWRHLAVVYSVSAGTKEIYIDGESVTSTGVSVDALTSDRSGAYIGRPSDGDYFDGRIDDVRLYNRALSDSEIGTLAGGGGGEEPTYYTLTVNSGSGDGEYEEDDVANISADSPPAYKQFYHWVGNTSGIANVNSSSTTLTMPAADQTITATYTDILYTLTVNSGSGDGSYAHGTNVNISANAAPSGYQFDDWIGNTSGIADVDDPTTTLTVPGANQTITATYQAVATYTLTVNSGSGDGSYTASTVVNISANAAASGYQFDCWVGNTSYIANVNASSTTLTMPAANQTITATYEQVQAGNPSISSTSGTWSNGNSITISGSSFGSKGTAEPMVWATFDSDIDPTDLGTQTSWGSVGNMAWSSDYGGTAKASNGSGTWTLMVSKNYWTSDGQKIYVYKKEKKNFTITDDSQNWKIWRMWASGYTYPNIYASTSNGRVYVEGMGSESGFWGLDRTGTTDWVTVELIVRASTYGNKDGLLTVLYDNDVAGSGTIMTRDGTDSDYMTMNFVIHGVLANSGSWDPAWSDSNRMWADDVYVDDTWARVVVGDASTWNGCSKKEMQIPSAWSGNSITVTAHQGGFGSFSGKYLYVIDADGNVSSGYGL